MKRLFIILLLVLSACSAPMPEHYPDMAKCITEKGVVEYGTFWCPKCAKVKKAWGDAWQYLTYVECDPRGDNPETQRCLDEKIERYATFRKPDGSELCCEPTPEELAEWAGCEVPSGS